MQDRRRSSRTGVGLTPTAVACAATALMMLARAPGVSATPPGGRSLYVSHSAEDQPARQSHIARFTLDGAGLLRPAETQVTCSGARASVFTPDLRFAYVSCFFAGEIRAYRVAANGVLTSIGHVRFVGALGLAIAPDGRTLYAGSAETGTLAAFRVGADGNLALFDYLPSGAPPPAKGLAITPDGRFVYVSHGSPRDTAASDLTGFELAVDGSFGKQIASVTNGIAAFDTVVTPDGRFLYVVSALSERVFGYRIGTDGSLAPVPGGSFPSGVFSTGAAISPDGRWLFVAAGGEVGTPPGVVSGWSIGTDGALTEIAGLPIKIDDDPIGLELSPDGRRLFMVEFLKDRLLTFDVSSRGQLTELQNVPSGGLDPTSEAITILPNLGPVAAFSVAPGRAGTPTQFDGDGSADRDGTVSRYDWDFGDGTIVPDGGAAPRHVYTAPGTYQVRLTVVDDEGCSARPIFTGQLASCVGTAAATATRSVVVP